MNPFYAPAGMVLDAVLMANGEAAMRKMSTIPSRCAPPFISVLNLQIYKCSAPHVSQRRDTQTAWETGTMAANGRGGEEPSLHAPC